MQVFRKYHKVILTCVVLFFVALDILAQSSSIELPTPITSNELIGTINARNIGDARLTTYYFWFDGSTGDVFINLVSKNFAGDIDIFVQSGLRQLTKIVVYPDFGEVETGRVIYLRKPERLLLRVQGRSPNDDPAQFRLKFAGGFIAGTPSKNDLPDVPQVTTAETGNVRVNSVGTIIPPVVPVATKDETAIPETVENDEKAKVAEVAKVENVDDKTKKETTEKTEPPKYEVAITDDLKVAEPVALPPPVRKNVRRRTRAKRPPVKTKLETVSKAEEVIDPLKTDTDSEPVPANKATAVKKKEAKPDPLANVQLVIVFRDGRRIERPLPEVFRFTVDRGILTVVSKDGRVGKYSMIDVLKVTIE